MNKCSTYLKPFDVPIRNSVKKISKNSSSICVLWKVDFFRIPVGKKWIASHVIFTQIKMNNYVKNIFFLGSKDTIKMQALTCLNCKLHWACLICNHVYICLSKSSKNSMFGIEKHMFLLPVLLIAWSCKSSNHILYWC